MKQKILSFIYNQETNKFLILNMIKHPDYAPEGGWFTVTGEIEENESSEDAVKREVMEETGLNIQKLLSLNWVSIYDWKGESCKEMNYLVFVESEEVELNEEHDNYELLTLDEFVDKIDWDDDKNLLIEVLEKAIEKKLYFNEEKIIDYRKNKLLKK